MLKKYNPLFNYFFLTLHLVDILLHFKTDGKMTLYNTIDSSTNVSYNNILLTNSNVMYLL